MSGLGPPVTGGLAPTASAAVERAAARLNALQDQDGSWRFDIDSGILPACDWLLLHLWLHPPANGTWEPPAQDRVQRAATSILARRNEDGGYALIPGGPSELNASIMACFAFRLARISDAQARIEDLRKRILALGGLGRANPITKIKLGLFGLIPRQAVPSIAPEWALLPRHVLSRMSAWARGLLVPISIVQTLAETQRPVPSGFHLNDLVAPGENWQKPFTAPDSLWGRVFRKGIGFFGRGGKGLRQRGLEAAGRWLLEQLAAFEGIAGHYLPMLYSILALDLLGFGPETQERRKAQEQFDRLLDNGWSAIRDTAVAAYCIGESLPAGAGRPWAEWLVTMESTRAMPRCADTTAGVLLALRSGFAVNQSEVIEEHARRGLDWLRSVQSKNGGWAAFDKDSDWEAARQIPLAGDDTLRDPACPDVTGRVIEALVKWGASAGDAAVRRGIEFLTANQEPDASWRGRWGAKYIYGTCHALRGLRAAGFDDHDAVVLRAGEWLRSIQNADGGWGEDGSDLSGPYAAAPSTASQTAWAIMGLIAGGDTTSESLRLGVDFLVRTQRPDGGWEESLATASGTPGIPYVRSALYPLAFPLLALVEFVRSREGNAR